jgi:hypothetical protein
MAPLPSPLPLGQAPPEHRLPLLYLVDSILKNVGGRYTELLARDIGTIFIDGYRIVGEKDRFNFIRCVRGAQPPSPPRGAGSPCSE